MFIRLATDLQDQFSGQSYKAPTIVIYDSRVVPDLKLPHIMTLDLVQHSIANWSYLYKLYKSSLDRLNWSSIR